MPAGPIFIAGTDRAGKTLLSAILSSDERITIPAVGSNMWTLFYRRFGDLTDDGNFERCLAAMLRYKHVRFLEPDEDEVRAAFRSGQRTYARLFEILQTLAAARSGKPRWGDQTGLIEGYADDVLEAYPDAVMLHMIRDPRDRYDASLTMWPEGRLRVGGATARWLYSARHALRNRRRHRGRYMVIRYEDLVTNPAEVMVHVCQFIGERFVPAMLDLNGMPTYREKLRRGSRTADEPLISPAYVGIYRGRIPPRELRFLESVAAADMRRVGYRPEGSAVVGVDRLRYAAWDLPLNAGRMAAWHLRDSAGRILPEVAGRRPPGHHEVSDGN